MKILNYIRNLLHPQSHAITLSQELKLYKTLVGATSQLMLILDKNKYIISIYNLSEAAKMNLPADHFMVGKQLCHLANNESSPFHDICDMLTRAVDNVFQTGNPTTLEYKILNTHLRTTISKIQGEYILLQIHDVTDIMQKLYDSESASYKELSMALTAGGLTSWSYDIKTKMISSSHQNNIIGSQITFEELISSVLPEYQQDVITMYDNIIYRQAQHCEITVKVKDLKGNIQWANVHAIPHSYDSDGNLTVISGSQKDITLEYEYNARINLLNKQNELIMNNISSGLVYITPDFRVVWENVSKVLHSPSNKQYYATNTYCYEAFNRTSPCEKCVMRRAMQSHKNELSEFINEDGRSYEIIANPILSAEDVIEGIVLKIDDITDKKNTIRKLKIAEQEVSETDQLLFTILNHLPSSLFVKNANDDYKYIIANKQFCEGLGLSEKEVIGKTDYEIFPQAEAAQYRMDDTTAVESNQIKIIDSEYVTLKDRIAVWYTIKTPLINIYDNNKKLLIGIGLDITENHNAYQELAIAKKKAEESDKLKSAFLANMSHEIRTPLNAIVGFSELMQSCDNKAEQEEYMRIISTNNDLLLRLINDILDLSKLDSGIIQLQNSTFDLALYFEELSATMRQRMTNPNIKFITINPYQSCIVDTDKTRIAQVWQNFMTNAIKYTISGHIKMGYEYIDGGIKIYVEDTGIGIPENKKSKLFQRFEKLDSFAQGTGLGLSICKAISELDKGKVGFESTEGKGSLFWSWKPMEAKIILKTNSEDKLPVNIQSKPTNYLDIEKHLKELNYRILVAEDNDSNYLLIKSILKGFNLTRTTDGLEAVEKVKKEHFDLVLMDIKMPIMDGIIATQEIRKFNNEITIIALTANAFESDRQEALNAGCTNFITKPVSKAKLFEILCPPSLEKEERTELESSVFSKIPIQTQNLTHTRDKQ